MHNFIPHTQLSAITFAIYELREMGGNVPSPEDIAFLVERDTDEQSDGTLLLCIRFMDLCGNQFGIATIYPDGERWQVRHVEQA